jgi:hypothetical protein
MAFVACEELQQNIVEDLTLELKSDATFNADILAVKVKNALREVETARKYPAEWDDESIEEDMDNYYPQVRKLALYDYNTIGAEGEASHSENGISRNYTERSKCLNGVIPIARY